MILLISLLALVIKYVFGTEDPPDDVNSLETYYDNSNDRIDEFERRFVNSFEETVDKYNENYTTNFLHELDTKNISSVNFERSYNVRANNGKIGGYEVSITKFPYQLALLFRGQFVCGASVISRHWGLTAAHCTGNKPPASQFAFRGGSAFVIRGGSVHKIRKYFTHPKWNVENRDYDFCLMRVAKPFRYTKSLAPIGLGAATPPGGTYVVVSGWGFTQPVGKSPIKLKAADLFTVPAKKCYNTYPSRITPRMFCAGYPKRESCRGDDGSPLVDIDARVQVGIVSWGKTCSGFNRPAVYANIASARQWIFNKVGIKKVQVDGQEQELIDDDNDDGGGDEGGDDNGEVEDDVEPEE